MTKGMVYCYYGSRVDRYFTMTVYDVSSTFTK